jgi:acyl transferase domain-containing protein/predicted naringenin-chalcone synthase/ubiquinone/menaquinone biosynthesis C-methylase UbiE/acyl carrier protein
MGLIGSLLGGILTMVPTYVFSPLAFIQNPALWLEVITKYKATVTGGPNFAYDYCTQRVTESQMKKLDLSSLKLCFAGAEPIRYSSLKAFADRFSSVGFKFSAFFPCYGLAEATLMVSGKLTRAEEVKYIHVDQNALQQNRIVVKSPESTDRTQILVSSGYSSHIQPIEIVDPNICEKLVEPFQIGEIWVRRNNQTPIGYWNNEELTHEIFNAKLKSDDQESFYLRTGDLGFVDTEKALFVCGRIKDLIIVHGRNIYPQDIEAIVEDTSNLVRKGCSAAFGLLDKDNEERLVIVCEVKDVNDHDKEKQQQLFSQIRTEISKQLQVHMDTIVLIKQKTIPKTTSGKIRRSKCKQLFLEKKLETIAIDRKPIISLDVKMDRDRTETLLSPSSSMKLSFEEIISQLVKKIAKTLDVNEEGIDVNKPFTEQGLDSLKISILVGELSAILGRDVSPTLFFEFPSISALATYLSGQELPQKQFNTVNLDNTEDIAVVGMACRFPGADCIEQFWTNLLAQTSAPSSVRPKYRVKGTTHLSLIEEVFQFDSDFFSISKREAKEMDPQQRILLEVCWELLEDAGIAKNNLNGERTGVFIGASSSDFALENYRHTRSSSIYATTGSALSILANRLSYIFNLRGPSMVIDSACSSSLLAVHQACQSIRSGECSSAIAGGINVILSDSISQSLKDANFLSPDGQCKAFDADANGYVRGEGCGLVFLRPLSKALEANDQIYAIIKGSAVIQDGKSNGLTAPNQKAQELVISEACRRSNIRPSDIYFVECHGTGTYLGDPIEAQALGKVVGNRDRVKPCLIGSVKSNIGHLEAAAGIAGLIKTILSLQYKLLPPTVNIKTPHPLIPFEKLNLKLATKKHDLPEETVLAGVSSFGFGGTNVHLIASSYRSPRLNVSDEPKSKEFIFPLSASNEQSLKHLVGKYINYLQNVSDNAGNGLLSNISYSLCLRRSHLSHRICVCGGSLSELMLELKKFRNGKDSINIKRGTVLSNHVNTIFVFPGQGVDYVSQAKILLPNKAFSETLKEVQLTFHKLGANVDIYATINNYASRKDQLLEVQAAIFSVQVALCSYWKSLGVTPYAVIGHSLGEVTAAYIAGALSLESAVHIVYYRSILLQDKLKGKGKMVIARIDRETAQEIADNIEGISIAAINSAKSITFAVDTDKIRILDALLRDNNVSYRYLDMEYAFHSPQVKLIEKEFLESMKDLQLYNLHIPLFSTSRGIKMHKEDGMQLNAQYWLNNMLSTVSFGPACELIVREKQTHATQYIFLEMAGREVLTPIVQQILTSLGDKQSRAIATLSKHDSSMTSLFASLYVAGQEFNWKQALGDAIGNAFIRLPSYSWNHSTPLVPSFINKKQLEIDNDPLNVDEIVRKVKSDHIEHFEIVKQFGELMENICITYILHALAAMGYSKKYKEGDCITFQQVSNELSIDKSHYALFKHILRILEKYRYLVNDGENTWKIMKLLPTQKYLHERIEQLMQEGKTNFKTFSSEINMIERSGKELHNALQGKVSGLQILFPNGSMDNTEALYERSLLSELYNSQVCSFFEQAMMAIASSNNNSRFRQKILEIGAGTGGLTSHVLETLSSENLTSNSKDLRTATVHEYVFTDVSKLFLSYAKQKFSSCSYMKYQLLDIEKSPSLQGFKKHYYDFILAANVLHAVMNLNQTLKNIKELLKPGGILVILEVTRPTLFLDLTFGLLDGWWRFCQFGNQDLRENYPLLSWSEWNLLLMESGFSNINRISAQFDSTHAIEEELQSVIIAQLLDIEEDTDGETEQDNSVSTFHSPIQIHNFERSIDENMVNKLKSLIQTMDRNDSNKIKELNSLLEQFIRNVLSQILMINELELDTERNLDSLGLDSLMGMELRNLIQIKLNVKLPISALIGEGDNSTITVSSLTKNVVQLIVSSDEPIQAIPKTFDIEHKDEIVNENFMEDIIESSNDGDCVTKACILAMGVAIPKYRYTQKEMADMAVNFYGLQNDDKKKEKLYKIFEGSEIDTRYSVCNLNTIDKKQVFSSFQARNQIYEVEAVELAVQSATKALENWGGDRSKITHVVSVSTTGNKIPGIEFELIHKLGLSRQVQRVAVNFMGCFGALPGLKTAASFAQMNSKHRVLLVSTEICSIHTELEATTENFVSCAIFADGSAAAIIGCGDPEFESYEKPHFEILKTTSYAIQDSLDKMFWKVTDTGWRLGLSRDIPDLIFNNIEHFVKQMLGPKYGKLSNIPNLDADWAIHPGGKAILIAIEKVLNLSKERTYHSWQVMKERGNMSSSTILHILHQMIEEQTVAQTRLRPITCCMVFGPGLTMEGCILRRMNK